ncbi:MAG: hypothetical protein K8F56_08890, partial [Rhodocyclaceae bacterium]|nr:hypothetical protein [Rhodocyclaceae bacterium]
LPGEDKAEVAPLIRDLDALAVPAVVKWLVLGVELMVGTKVSEDSRKPHGTRRVDLLLTPRPCNHQMHS